MKANRIKTLIDNAIKDTQSEPVVEATDAQLQSVADEFNEAIPGLDPSHPNYGKYVKRFQQIKNTDPELYAKILSWD